ncbi:MAG: potassium/proton antiporter [Cardiobacteriaceae bacterium]|nr:potassium/proton antiporter [Cardiobacteriaceae bacterium]
MESMNLIFLIFAFLFFISIVATRLSAHMGMPLLLVFLGVGMLAGEEGIGGIQFNNFLAANLVGQLALAIILLDGGLRTSVSSFRISLKPAIVLASWGVLATVLALGLFTTFFFNVNWQLGFLMAAIVGSTDAAAVFSLLRNSGVRLNSRILSTLELESGANDPMAIFLVTAMITMINQPENASIFSFLWMLLQQLCVGLLLGWLAGKSLAWLLRHLTLAEGLYALLIASGGLMLFALSNLMGGSGFLAVYLAGIIIGNSRSKANEHLFNVMDGLAWLAQASMFLVLGLLVTPSRLFEQGFDALIIAGFLILVARPLAVYSSLIWFSYGKREKAYISWVGLRGAVPITLAMTPLMEGVAHSRLIFDVIFSVVILSLLIQGTSIGLMARKLKVALPPHPEPLSNKDLWLTDKLTLQLQSFKVAEYSQAEGSHPYALTRMKDFSHARLFALIRDGAIMKVGMNTKMKKGDIVWYVFPEDKSSTFAEQFVSRQQNESEQAFYGEVEVKPYIRMGELAQTHQLNIRQEDYDRTLGELFRERFGDVPVAGDKLDLHGCEITVKELDEHGYMKWIGVKMPEMMTKTEM